MTRRRTVLAVFALAAAIAIAGCLDAIAPGAPHAFARIGIVPVFDGAANRDGIPADVDLIRVTIHHPPNPDIVVSQRIVPGQDSIVIAVEVPLANGVADTVTMGFDAIRSSDGVSLYQGSQEIAVRIGVLSQPDSVHVRYVGPGQNLQSISITPTAIAVRPGDSVGFNVLALDSTGATVIGMPVLFQSRSATIATVTQAGTARGVADGRTYVIATSGARSSVRDSALVVVSTTPAAVISLAPDAVSFTAPQGGNPAPQTVAATNGGGGTLTGLVVTGIAYGASEPTAWLAATFSQTTAPATLTLQPTTGSLAPGTYHATVTVGAALASNSPQTVAVTFTVIAGPSIGHSAAAGAVSFNDTTSTTDNPARTVTVYNNGGGTLSGLAVGPIGYGTGPTGWLTASLDQTTAPATLTLSAAKGSLVAGIYTATVPITSGVASNSPQTLTVTFVVVAGPAIALSSTAVTFTDTITTADNAAQTVAVTNSGNVALSGLAVGTIGYGSGATGWLTASLNQATAPATLTLSAAKGSLAAGTYTATVPITSSVASNSPQTVTVTFDLRPVPLVGIQVTPGFRVMLAADTVRLAVSGKDGSGNPVTPTDLRFLSRTPGVVSVDSMTGLMTGVVAGTAVVVASAQGAFGAVLDSMLVAVPASGQAVAYLTVNGRSFGSARVGDTLRVMTGVDLRAVPGEKLGSYNAQLDWTPAVATFQSIGAVLVGGFVAPTVNTGNTASGQVRFGAADAAGATPQPVGLAGIILTATAAGSSALTFTLTDLSAALTFTNLLTRAPAALVVSGAVRVQ